MTSQRIFCNSPWYELHIYWDGGLGFCCQEDHRAYPAEQNQQYNISRMTIREWYNSEPMRQVRTGMFSDSRSSICRKCYHEEDFSATSRRHRSNQKSVIFTRSNFKESYEQSPGHNKFEHSRQNQGDYDGVPIDLHIDLGNYCNLTCKMCGAHASSSIAAQEVKWGNLAAAAYIGSDWTRDEAVWQRVIHELADIKDLRNVHFMGGETLITKRFEDFVDFMTERGRFDLNFSWVTNGTTFNESLMKKLSRFKRIGIEVSIEATTAHNAYQRQGTDTELVLANMERYMSYCDDANVTLTVRPAISLLTIGYYDTLLRYCLEHKLLVKGLMATNPKFLDVRILPDYVRVGYQRAYRRLAADYRLENIDHSVDYNESDPNEYCRVIANQVIQCLNLLEAPRLPNSDALMTEMVAWCRKWDTVHGYDALKLYPELKEEFVNREY